MKVLHRPFSCMHARLGCIQIRDHDLITELKFDVLTKQNTSVLTRRVKAEAFGSLICSRLSQPFQQDGIFNRLQCDQHQWLSIDQTAINVVYSTLSRRFCIPNNCWTSKQHCGPSGNAWSVGPAPPGSFAPSPQSQLSWTHFLACQERASPYKFLIASQYRNPVQVVVSFCSQPYNT